MRAAEILKARKDHFVKISVAETTSTAEYASFDHFLTVHNLEETAAVITSLKGEIAISEGQKRGYIDRVPFGVVFGESDSPSHLVGVLGPAINTSSDTLFTYMQASLPGMRLSTSEAGHS